MKEENTNGTVSARKDPYPDLKALRESKGKTLKEISQTTRIRLVYLEAIESGQFHLLPEPTYAENFMKAYAHETEVDIGVLLSHYREYLRELVGSKREESIEKKSFRSPKIHLDIGGWVRSLAPAVGWVQGHFKSLGWSLAVLAVGVAVFFFLYSEENPEPDVSRAPMSVATEQLAAPGTAGTPVEPAKEPGKEGTTVSPAGQSTAQPQQEARTAAEPAKTPLTLVITAKEMTWVRVVEDKNPPYQVLLRPGDRVERQAENLFSIDVGNAGGIDIQFQGKSLGQIGKRGEVVHFVLPEDARQD